MNAPSRPSNVSGRGRSPLPALPTVHEAKGRAPQLPRLVTENMREPFQLLVSHPLNLICQFHNVKRVSLEEGVPPPSRFDVPLLQGGIENADALLPSHVLAVYDHDNTPDESEGSSLLSPPQVHSFSGQPQATLVLIPVNSYLWERYFTTVLPKEHPSPPPIPAIETMRRRSRADSMASRSSQELNRNSPGRSRPRSVLSLPVHVVHVPSAKSLPLLILSSLKILPHNAVLPALLPRKVLAELPAPPTVLAQHLLQWLYPSPEDQERRNVDSLTASSPLTHNMPMPRSPRRPPSPLLSASDSDAVKRFSSASTSSFLSAGSSFSSFSSASPPTRSDQEPETICALAEPATRDDPDLRLLALTQQNFGLWANALALGVRDPAVVRLVELAWSVASEARRVRFNIGDQSDVAIGIISDNHGGYERV